ncbi:Snf7-domain-containing protein [Acaromyces ingoldii]|uniref:Snf7-domain-containing protein n=1 Tax=Acaromyces ingoldii TaxID=215250 RepID=A0A316YMY1_9BASI|nr:Snf7-domain-containing protein [Acaromyces ingoldii]PWN89423.1 Snf7-domain-containing protein [Acaromyces ingoldii]
MGNQASKSGTKITPQDRAILDLKVQRDKVKQYQKKLQTLSSHEHRLAQQFLASGDRAKALACLRRRRYQETQLSQTDSQLANLEGLVSSIEFAQVQTAVVEGLRQGNAVLKEMHRQMDLASVERLMEETAEAQAYQRDIDEAIQTQMSREDQEEVDREMEKLEREVNGVQEDVPVSMPEAPTTEPAPISRPAEEATAARQQQEEETEQRTAVLA